MPKEKICPLLKSECSRESCHWWVHLLGKNPQTGGDVDESRCAVAWLPIMLCEVSQKGLQTTAAVESTRNELVKRLDHLVHGIVARLATGAIETPAGRKELDGPKG